VSKRVAQRLGFGFRCGFLGLLHLEIVVERISREFNLEIITTSPSVIYRFTLNDNSVVEVDNPAHYPDPAHIAWVEEPWVKSHIIVPADYMGAVMNLALEKRGTCQKMRRLTPNASCSPITCLSTRL